MRRPQVSIKNVMKKKDTPISVRAGKLEFVKINATTWDWRDGYHWILSLSWPRFSALVLGLFTGLNLVFAAAYTARSGCIAEMPPGSFLDAMFFSVETLATVGYGHMHPATLYGHLVTTLEIIAGMFWTAVMTGVIFVRFARPNASIAFSKTAVITRFDGQATLMLRVANLRHRAMVEAEFRLMLLRNEPVKEGDHARRFHPLTLTFDRLIMFPAALTLRHIIDETSPLHGMSAEDFERTDTRLMASVVCVDSVIHSPVHSQHDYAWDDIHFGKRFVEIYAEATDGKLMVDYGRLNEVERDDLPAG
jgi:inward rectifier potassium channel